MIDVKTIILNTLAIFILVDIAMIIFILLAIAGGEPVNHIPFWDVQIKFIIGLLS